MATETRVMIAGSRYATRAALDYARRVVQRVHQLGWTVLVGDNPMGVDMAVVNECRRLKAKVIVVGLTEHPRNGGCGQSPHGQYVRFERGGISHRRVAGCLQAITSAIGTWWISVTERYSSGTAIVAARKRATSTHCSVAKKRNLINFERSSVA